MHPAFEKIQANKETFEAPVPHQEQSGTVHDLAAHRERVRAALKQKVPEAVEQQKSDNDLQTDANVLRRQLEKFQDDPSIEAHREVGHLQKLLDEQRAEYSAAQQQIEANAQQKSSFARFLSKNFGELAVEELKLSKNLREIQLTESHLKDAQQRAQNAGLVFANMEKITMQLRQIEDERASRKNSPPQTLQQAA